MPYVAVGYDGFLINRTLTRYCTSIDLKDWELFRSCFTNDCVAHYDGLSFAGQTMANEFEEAHRDVVSLHSLSNVDILSLHSGRATVRAYVDALLVERGHVDGDHLQVVGVYEDLVRFVDGQWRIADRTFTTRWATGNRMLLRRVGSRDISVSERKSWLHRFLF